MLSSLQLVELVVVFVTASNQFYGISKAKSAFAYAQAKGGTVRPDTMPTGLLGVPFSAFQAIVFFLVPTIYIFVVTVSGFHQPQWMNAFALPEIVWMNVLRLLCCAATFHMRSITASTFDHLSDQYHPIGRREKPRIVQTGPYAWVRHPLYTLALLQTALQAFLFWSYVPLFGLVATVAMFVVKIPIEEETIQRDAAMKEEYHTYMRKVPTRLIPYVW